MNNTPEEIERLYREDPRVFYSLMQDYADAHGISLVQAIRVHLRVKMESVPAKTEDVKAALQKIMQEDEDIIRALKDKP